MVWMDLQLCLWQWIRNAVPNVDTAYAKAQSLPQQFLIGLDPAASTALKPATICATQHCKLQPNHHKPNS
jgi:hypothetical protein